MFVSENELYMYTIPTHVVLKSVQFLDIKTEF